MTCGGSRGVASYRTTLRGATGIARNTQKMPPDSTLLGTPRFQQARSTSVSTARRFHRHLTKWSTLWNGLFSGGFPPSTSTTPGNPQLRRRSPDTDWVAIPATKIPDRRHAVA